MSQINIEISHKLEQAEALRRIKGISALLKKQYAEKISNLNERWDNNFGKLNLVVMGHTVSLSINVTKTSVGLNADLPFAASFFKGKIENVVREKLALLLQSDSGSGGISAKVAAKLSSNQLTFKEVALTVTAALIITTLITEIFCEKKISRKKAKDAARVICGI